MLVRCWLLSFLAGKKLMTMLESSGIECLVFDIQDVGARFYTYIWLLFDCMVACAKLGVKVSASSYVVKGRGRYRACASVCDDCKFQKLNF